MLNGVAGALVLSAQDCLHLTREQISLLSNKDEASATDTHARVRELFSPRTRSADILPVAVLVVHVAGNGRRPALLCAKEYDNVLVRPLGVSTDRFDLRRSSTRLDTKTIEKNAHIVL